MNLQVGASYDVAKDLNVEVDFQYVGWSAYKTLTIDLPKSPTSVTIATGATTTKTVAQAPIVSEKNWDDGLLFRAGIEYQYNENLTLRAGGLLDYSPQPTSKMEPMLPDANRVDLSFGAGYKLNENMTIDLVYMAVLFEERSTTYTPFPASYNSMAHIVGFNFGYSF
jgi:long-chain fatty acid transport protein